MENNNEGFAHNPDWAHHPGKLIAARLDEEEMSQIELAKRMDRPIEQVNRLIHGKISVTPQTAIELERALGAPATYWNTLQKKWDEYQAKEQESSRLDSMADWLHHFPLRKMSRHWGYVVPSDTRGACSSLLSFFRVASPSAFDAYWKNKYNYAFMHSKHHLDNRYSVLTWLRQGQRVAEMADSKPYSSEYLIDVVKKIRTLSASDNFQDTLRQSISLFAEIGVVVVILQELSDLKISGAFHWHRDIPIIQVSLCSNREDEFWITLFHEAGHLATSRKKDSFIDLNTFSEDSRAERLANVWANDILFDGQSWNKFIANAQFTQETIRNYAIEQETSVALVVGRLWQEERVSQSRTLHTMMKRLSWKDIDTSVFLNNNLQTITK